MMSMATTMTAQDGLHLHPHAEPNSYHHRNHDSARNSDEQARGDE